MYSVEKLLEMITSLKSSDRYDACEWLRIAQESSPDIIYALRKATFDDDKEVATRAYMALQADVHQKMMIDMGLIKAEVTGPLNGEIQDTDIGQAGSTQQGFDEYARMLKVIRNWGFWNIGLGVMHLVISGIFSAPWGVLLIIVGLASLFFPTASMFIIYAVTISWAAVWNLLSFNLEWAIFAMFQVYFTIRIILDYRRYRKVEEPSPASAIESSTPQQATRRADRYFPWIGSCMGCSSLFGYIVFIFIIILAIIVSPDSVSFPDYFSIIEGILINIGLLGFAIGLASLLSRYRPMALGVLGLVAGALTLVVYLALLLISRLI